MLNITVHGRGKALVLLHGWGFDSQIWHSIQPELSNRYQLYLVDLPGFGLSPSVDWENFKSILLKQLPAHFAIAGWSMGGLFATRLAIEAPCRVSHLLNIASSPCFIRDKQWPGVERLVFTTFYNSFATNPERTLNEFIQLQRQGSHSPVNKSAILPTQAGLRSGLDALSNWDFRQALFDINMPVCYLFGQLDAVTPRKLMNAMQIIYPDFDYVMFRKAAHMPFLSHPDEFILMLDKFIV